MLYMPTGASGEIDSLLYQFVPIRETHTPYPGLLFAFQWLYINLQSKYFILVSVMMTMYVVLLFTVLYVAVISIFVFNAKTPLSSIQVCNLCVRVYVYIHCGRKNSSVLKE